MFLSVTNIRIRANYRMPALHIIYVLLRYKLNYKNQMAQPEWNKHLPSIYKKAEKKHFLSRMALIRYPTMEFNK